jgi:hypothetical protein
VAARGAARRRADSAEYDRMLRPLIAPGDTLLATESPVTKVQTITRLFGSVVGFGSTVSNLSD